MKLIPLNKKKAEDKVIKKYMILKRGTRKMFKYISTEKVVYEQVLRRYFKFMKGIMNQEQKSCKKNKSDCDYECSCGCFQKRHLNPATIKSIEKMQAELRGMARALGFSYEEMKQIMEKL